jgi:hypothetical protein
VATSYQHQNLVIFPEDDPLEAISRQGAPRALMPRSDSALRAVGCI